MIHAFALPLVAALLATAPGDTNGVDTPAYLVVAEDSACASRLRDAGLLEITFRRGQELHRSRLLRSQDRWWVEGNRIEVKRAALGLGDERVSIERLRGRVGNHAGVMAGRGALAGVAVAFTACYVVRGGGPAIATSILPMAGVVFGLAAGMAGGFVGMVIGSCMPVWAECE